MNLLPTTPTIRAAAAGQPLPVRRPASRQVLARRRALSLIEVVASTLIVGLMAVAALNSLGAATRASESIGNRAVALALADNLMAEILEKAYQEPVTTPALFGPDSGETGGTRAPFDDIDDYHGWDRSPPEEPDGTPIPDRADWRRRVTVERVRLSNFTETTGGGADEGVKRIRVTVEYRDQVLAEQFAIRSNTD